ncbi:hypothetical protein [Streptomyces sp900105755]|uniref:SCP2 domain-containing protein n=1 Tax=Streptomyces sp. 900105755 TaxID=3154389 RepID=A0ABV1TW24_9ACTN
MTCTEQKAAPDDKRPDPPVGQRKAAEAEEDLMVPSSKIFFEEVRAAYAAMAGALHLAGPVEAENVLPVSTYTGGGVDYSVELDVREGYVDCVVGTETETVDFTVNVEQLALTAGVIECHGKISYSARNLAQLRPRLRSAANQAGQASVLSWSARRVRP